MSCCFRKPKTNEHEQPMNNAMAEKPKPVQVQNKPQTQDPGPNQSPSKAQPHPTNLPPPTSQIEPQATVAQPHSTNLPPPTFQIEPQATVAQPQPPNLPPPTSQIEPQTTVAQPHPPNLPPPTSQIQPQATVAQPHPPNLPPPTSQIQPQATVAQPSLPQTPSPTLEECINRFGKIKNAGEVDYLIDLIDQLVHVLLNRPTQEKALPRSTSSETYSDTLKDRAKSVWASFLGSGSVFLEFVNKHIQLEKADEGTRQVIGRILQSVGKVHWVVAGLSVVAFLLDQIGQISDNRNACIDLLKQMSKLAGHIRKLNYDMPQEYKILKEAIVMIVEGSMMCASQLNSRTLFRFLKASVDSERLGALQQKIDQVYRDLTLRVAIEIRHSQPVEFPAWNPIYPDYAVGIDEQKKQVQKLLELDRRNKESVAVVIYGFGGIGKTTLATAVIADIDLTDYNYSAVQLQEDQSRNDIKSMQQQILKDAFPDYTYDRNITLRNSAEGRDHLFGAFQAQKNKPVFLFIDNALRVEDLEELFPKRLSALPTLLHTSGVKDDT